MTNISGDLWSLCPHAIKVPSGLQAWFKRAQRMAVRTVTTKTKIFHSISKLFFDVYIM